jgi:hypothetical protein
MTQVPFNLIGMNVPPIPLRLSITYNPSDYVTSTDSSAREWQVKMLTMFSPSLQLAHRAGPHSVTQQVTRGAK